MSLERVRDACREAGRCFEEGRLADGAKLAAEAVDLAAESLGEGHYGYAQALCTRGWLEQANGDVREAATTFGEAAVRARSLGVADPEHGVAVLKQVAEFLRETGRKDEARHAMADIVTIYAAQLGRDHPRYLIMQASSEDWLEGKAETGRSLWPR